MSRRLSPAATWTVCSEPSLSMKVMLSLFFSMFVFLSQYKVILRVRARQGDVFQSRGGSGKRGGGGESGIPLTLHRVWAALDGHAGP